MSKRRRYQRKLGTIILYFYIYAFVIGETPFKFGSETNSIRHTASNYTWQGSMFRVSCVVWLWCVSKQGIWLRSPKISTSGNGNSRLQNTKPLMQGPIIRTRTIIVHLVFVIQQEISYELTSSMFNKLNFLFTQRQTHCWYYEVLTL